jgi:hypothetical protein
VNSDENRIWWRKIMRDMSHRAAAALTLGLLTDDLFGALLNAPSTGTAATTDRQANVAEYLAANRWLRDESATRRSTRTMRAAIVCFN